MIKIITTGAKSVLPFSPAIKAGDFVYVSGQASVDRENGSVIEGTFEEEMRRSIENLEVILKEAGLTLDHVINVKGYVADQKDLKEYNKIYPEYFKDIDQGILNQIDYAVNLRRNEKLKNPSKIVKIKDDSIVTLRE